MTSAPARSAITRRTCCTRAMAVEDTVAISFKNVVAPFYEATTTL